MSKLRRGNFIQKNLTRLPVIEKKWAYRFTFKTPKDLRTTSQLNKIYSKLVLNNKETLFYVFKSAFMRNPNFPSKNLVEINKSLLKINPLFINYFFKSIEMIVDSKINNLDSFSSNISKITSILTKFEYTKISPNHEIINFKNNEINKKLNEYIKFIIKTNEIERKSTTIILKEVDRLKAGLVNTKLYSSDFKKTCSETYSGFLRVLNSRSPYFLKIKGRLYLGKSELGKEQPKSGFNKLLLDLETLDVYKFNVDSQGKYNLQEALVSFKGLNGFLNISLENYLLHLKENYINFYKNKTFKTEAQRERALNRIQDIFSNKRINQFVK